MTALPEPDPFAGDEEEHRPFPDPAHSLAPRKPRTVGGFVYLLVLAGTLAGLAVVALGPWRLGLSLVGVVLLAGALARLLVRNDDAGMLGVRRKAVDVTTLALLGGGLVALAAVIPPPPIAR